MGILGILNNGFLGMTAQSKSLSAISDNIANARTDGYKDKDYRFSTMVGSDVTSATYISRSPVYGGVANGVHADARTLADKQGTVRFTGETTNVAMVGDGWFVVRDQSLDDPDLGAPVNAPADAGIRYTRAGGFFLNKDGKLEGSNGTLLQGNPIAAGAEPANTDLLTLEDIQIPVEADGSFSLHARPTSLVTLGGSLGGDTPLSPSGAPILAASHRTSVELFDSIGRSFIVDLGFAKTAAPTDLTSDWEVYVTGLRHSASGAQVPGAGIDQDDPATWLPLGSLAFENGVLSGSSGQIVEVNGDQRTQFNLPLGAFTIAQPFGGESENQLDGVAGAGFGADGPVNLDIGAVGSELGLREDLTGGASQTYLLTQDGFRESGLNQVEIDAAGTVTVVYQSGARIDLATMGVARFRNDEGLVAESGTLFAESAASGTPYVPGSAVDEEGLDAIGPELIPLSVEASTVDITDQFTKLILTQRIYSANAKSLTTADELWQTAIQTAG